MHMHKPAVAVSLESSAGRWLKSQCMLLARNRTLTGVTLHVRFVPMADIAQLIQSPRPHGRAVKAEWSSRVGGGQVEDKIELGGLLDRKVGGLRTSQNLVDQFGGTPEQVRIVWSIRHKTARLDVLPAIVDRWQSRA